MRKSSGVIAVAICLLAGQAGFGAEPVTVLLEKGIYTEETAGNFEAAIRIYQQIVTNEAAARPAVAEAYFRLGDCQLKRGDKVKAQQALEFVVARFTDQEAVVQKARRKLALIRSELIALQPAPWVEGEMMQLSLKSAAGAEFGTIVYTADGGNTSIGQAWRIEQRMLVMANNSAQFTRVIARKGDFAPVQGLTVNQLGRFEAAYGDRKVDLKTTAAGQTTSTHLDTDGVVYDNEQALYLIRRLPLAEGYRASFPIFPVQGAAVVECRIEVVGRESLTVPAGAFDCLKVNLSVYADNVKAMEHQLWFSTDANKYLVRYDSGQAIMELVKASRRSPQAPSDFSDADLGISLTLPPNWLEYKNPSPGAYKFNLQFLPPEMKSWSGCLAIPQMPGLFASARAAAEGDVAVLKGFFKNYTVRPDSWSGASNAVQESSTFAADYDDQGKAMVEYRTYILGKSLVVWFVFRVEKAAFATEKPVFDALVASLRSTETEAKAPASDPDLVQKARVDMQVRKERLDQVEGMAESNLANAVRFIVADPIIEGIRKQLTEVKMAIESALAGAKDAGDAQVKALEAQRAKLEQQLHEALEGLKKGLRVDYEVARKKYDALRGSATGTVSESDKLESERLLMEAMQYKEKLQSRDASRTQEEAMRILRDAEAQFRKAVEKDVNNVMGWVEMGVCQLQQGLLQNARASLEKALEMEPGNAWAIMCMGSVAQFEGKIDEAIELFKKAIPSKPYKAPDDRSKATNALWELAKLYMQLGQYDSAAEYCQKFLDEVVDPESPDLDYARKMLEEAKSKAVTRKTDKIDYPFVDDPAVHGRWITVDFVEQIADFKAGSQAWKEDLFLKELTFEDGGETSQAWTWTKGLLLHHGDQTAAQYVIKTIGANDYLFMEWKSGDYTIRGRKPWYYVMKRAP